MRTYEEIVQICNIVLKTVKEKSFHPYVSKCDGISSSSTRNSITSSDKFAYVVLSNNLKELYITKELSEMDYVHYHKYGAFPKYEFQIIQNIRTEEDFFQWGTVLDDKALAFSVLHTTMMDYRNESIVLYGNFIRDLFG